MVTRSRAVAAEVGWADRFVRFLRILCLGRVDPRLVRDITRIVWLAEKPSLRAASC